VVTLRLRFTLRLRSRLLRLFTFPFGWLRVTHVTFLLPVARCRLFPLRLVVLSPLRLRTFDLRSPFPFPLPFPRCVLRCVYVTFTLVVTLLRYVCVTLVTFVATLRSRLRLPRLLRLRLLRVVRLRSRCRVYVVYVCCPFFCAILHVRYVRCDSPRVLIVRYVVCCRLRLVCVTFERCSRLRRCPLRTLVVYTRFTLPLPFTFVPYVCVLWLVVGSFTCYITFGTFVYRLI